MGLAGMSKTWYSPDMVGVNRRIVELASQGVPPGEIALVVGIATVAVSLILRSPLAQGEALRLALAKK